MPGWRQSPRRHSAGVSATPQCQLQLSCPLRAPVAWRGTPGARRLSALCPRAEHQATSLWKLESLAWGSSGFVLLQEEKDYEGCFGRTEETNPTVLSGLLQYIPCTQARIGFLNLFSKVSPCFSSQTYLFPQRDLEILKSRKLFLSHPYSLSSTLLYFQSYNVATAQIQGICIDTYIIFDCCSWACISPESQQAAPDLMACSSSLYSSSWVVS